MRSVASVRPSTSRPSMNHSFHDLGIPQLKTGSKACLKEMNPLAVIAGLDRLDSVIPTIGHGGVAETLLKRSLVATGSPGQAGR
jgi:hypothetical protein